MNGEADNSRFVNMHVYMHLAFKELTDLLQLEHWVYAKSVHAFMRLHLSIYHMQILIAIVNKYAG